MGQLAAGTPDKISSKPLWLKHYQASKMGQFRRAPSEVEHIIEVARKRGRYGYRDARKFRPLERSNLYEGIEVGPHDQGGTI
jgi:hypothetical protein